MGPHEMAMIRLHNAVKYDELTAFLKGSDVYFVASDPHDRNSPHAYGFSLAVYHKYALQNPQLHPDELFEQSIIRELQSKQCTYLDVYNLFNCLKEQLRLQHNGLASFSISEKGLDTLSKLLQAEVARLGDDLKTARYEYGKDYKNGCYEYMHKYNEYLFEETGHRLL